MNTSSSPILIISLDYPPNDGGVSRLAAGLVRTLHDRGIEVWVLTFVDQGRVGPERPKARYIEVDRKPVIRDWQIVCTVREYIARFGSDAPIIATLWNPEATLAMLAGARRVTILAHGNEVMAYARPNIKGWLRNLVLRRAKNVVCNSRFTERIVRELAGRVKTMVVNPAVDADAFNIKVDKSLIRSLLNIADDKRVVLTVSRLDYVKGHETVLRAIALLAPEVRENILYVIAGKGPMRQQLEKQVADLGIGSHVLFSGFVPDDELHKYYAAADVFVLPSIVDPKARCMEGFGMAFTEAQATGLPVIGTRSGGIPDAVHEGEGGWLIDERDAEALSNHLLRLYKDPYSFFEQGKLGAARVRRDMSWENYANIIYSDI